MAKTTKKTTARKPQPPDMIVVNRRGNPRDMSPGNYWFKNNAWPAAAGRKGN
jgi:hypothetical protein